MYECRVCGKGFKTFGGLQNHWHEEHDEDGPPIKEQQTLG